MNFEQFQAAVVAAVKAQRDAEGLTRVCSLNTIRTSYESGWSIDTAVELAYEDTYYDHGFARATEK